MFRDVLADKSIVVIGGTTGLGLSGAMACVAAGARVVVVGRDRESGEAAIASLGPKAAAFTGDACEPTTARSAIALALERWGSFDGLYHVAGGSGRAMGDGPTHELTDQGIQATITLNLTSCIYSNRAAITQFLHNGTAGTILNMGSVLGWSPSPAFFATHAYAATKAAIIGFTRSVAAYYAPQNIRANILAPGLVRTPMAKRAAENQTILDFVHTKQPLDGGRIGRPDDCDAAVVYFLSEASRFVTGQVLAVDGGWGVSEGQLQHT